MMCYKKILPRGGFPVLGNFLQPGFFQDHLDVLVPMITLCSKVQAHQALDIFAVSTGLLDFFLWGFM